MADRVLITGAAGKLGTVLTELLRARGAEVTASDLRELDVTDAAAVERTVTELQPGIILHCAAYTQVNRAEREPDRAERVNVDGTAHLAAAARRVGARLVYPSTDYVFDGARAENASPRPYDEEAVPRPLGVYGRTKWAGEERVRAAGGDYLIVRTSWLFGGSGRDFVKAIAAQLAAGAPLQVVNDQTGRPTYVRDLGTAILALLDREVTGCVHFANAGACTWYDLAAEVRRRLGASHCPLEAIPTRPDPALAPRPAWSVLETARYTARTGRAPRPWPAALAECLDRGEHVLA